MDKTAEANDAIEAPRDAQDDVDRYVDAAVGRPLPDGSDPVEAVIRDHRRRLERERYIAMREAVCESLAYAPRLEAERRLEGLKRLGISDDDPRCQLERLLADGYPDADPRVQLARMRMAGLPEDHPLVKELTKIAKESPAKNGTAANRARPSQWRASTTDFVLIQRLGYASCDCAFEPAPP